MNELSLCNLLSWAGRTGGVANAGVWTVILPRCSLRKLVAPNWTNSTVEHKNNGPNSTPAIPKRYPPPVNVFIKRLFRGPTTLKTMENFPTTASPVKYGDRSDPTSSYIFPST